MTDSKAVIRCQQRKKQQAIEYLGSKCSICGYNKCQAALEFHHVDETTKENMPSYVIHSWSLERAKKELDKCMLVCSNCHKEIHFGVYKPQDLMIFGKPKITSICPVCCAEYVTCNEQQVFCGLKCKAIAERKVNRPTKEQLQKEVAAMSFVTIGKKYGVSDNAVRKWCKGYNIVWKNDTTTTQA